MTFPMTDLEHSPATLTRRDGQAQAVFVREFDHPPEALWAALTDPSRVCDWLAPGEIELRQGGAVRLDFGDSGIIIDSVVSAYEPGTLLEYSWSAAGEPNRPVRWEVESLPVARSRLRLTLRVPEVEDGARSCAGWDAHLDMLAAALEGVPIRFPFPDFQRYRETYKKLAAAPAGG